MNKGKTSPAGFVPGAPEPMPYGARQAITGVDAGIGYSTHIKLVQDLLRAGKVILTRGEPAPVRKSHSDAPVLP